MPDSHLDKYTCMRCSKYIQRKVLDYHTTKEEGYKILCVVPGVGTTQGELKSLPSPLISIQQLEVIAISSCSSGASWWDVHPVCMLVGEVLPAETTPPPVSLQPFLWAAHTFPVP